MPRGRPFQPKVAASASPAHAALAVLSDPAAGPREKARAALQIAAEGVVEAEREHRLGAAEMRALCDALSEMRRTEAGFDEIAVARKELIAYSDAEAAVGWFVVQAIQAGERLAGVLGARLVQLSEDAAWRARPTADRVREVYQLVSREWDALRAIEAKDIRGRLVE